VVGAILNSYFDLNKTEAGCDEVGRGCVAGPVVAAAVILPKHFKHDFLNDSKKLSISQRKLLKIEIENVSLAYGIGEVTPQEIDDINILNASFLAMHRAIDQLKIKPELLLIDGNRYTPHCSIPYQCIIKGDSKFKS
jgi:ribonuclease HII